MKNSTSIKATSTANKLENLQATEKKQTYVAIRTLITLAYEQNKITRTKNKQCDASFQAVINNRKRFSFVIPKKDNNFRVFVKATMCSDEFLQKYSKNEFKNNEYIIHFDTADECVTILNDILKSLQATKILDKIVLQEFKDETSKKATSKKATSKKATSKK